MSRTSRVLCFLAIGTGVLLLGPILRPQSDASASSIALVALPPIDGCRSYGKWVADWAPSFDFADYTVANSYQCDGYRLHLSVAQYVQQYQGKEAVSEFNAVIPRSWWNFTERTQRAPSDELEVDEYRVSLPALHLTIWNWYAVGERATASGFGVKWLEATNAIRLRASATSNITVAVESDAAFDAEAALQSDAASVWTWFKSATNKVGN